MSRKNTLAALQSSAIAVPRTMIRISAMKNAATPANVGVQP